MAIASTVSSYLAEHDVAYDVLTHPHTGSSGETAEASHVPGGRLAKSVVLEDDQGYLMVVLPADRKVDLDELHRQLNRNLVRLSDINGPRGGRDKRCRLHLVMPGRANVVIEDTRADLYTAIDCAADRAARTVARKLARLRSYRRNRWTEAAVPVPVLSEQNA